MIDFDKQYVYSFTKEILQTDSPTGFTNTVMIKIQKFVEELGYTFERTNKGNGIISINGKSDKIIGLCAHVDTLGLMVRSIKANGTLAITKIGGPTLPTLDSEYCKVYTRDGKVYTGTILSNSPAIHVHKEASTAARNEETMHVRLDCVVQSKEEVEKLGISNGDFICIDTKTEITETDFIKSRFLDDKLSIGAIFGVLKHLKDNKIIPKHNVKVLISTYEEVGHGMAHLPEGISELLAVDMGCIGEDLSCTEHDVSICAKDSSGPYDYELTNKLIQLAKENNLKYAVDIYPFYGSDVSASLRAGHDVQGGLIGPGVSASHGMERSHYDSVYNTMKLISLYLNS
ncbi:MAG: aminopeptidase [Bacillales bacterium]|jgi:putative aminopeptidase FrvX|nr:aminopeptidase [Bacillales bacterium]